MPLECHNMHDQQKIKEKSSQVYIIFSSLPGIMVYLNTKINLRQCIIYIEPPNFDAADYCDSPGIRPRGYKTFSMLNSAEHEIFPAHKC